MFSITAPPAIGASPQYRLSPLGCPQPSDIPKTLKDALLSHISPQRLRSKYAIGTAPYRRPEGVLSVEQGHRNWAMCQSLKPAAGLPAHLRYAADKGELPDAALSCILAVAPETRRSDGVSPDRHE
jgi:hypothetical protein